MIRCGRRSRWTVHQSEHAAPPVTRPGVSMRTTSAACRACSTHSASAAVNCSRCPTGVTSPTKAIPRTGNSVASGESFSRTLQPTVVGGPMWDWPISASTSATGWRRAKRSTRASIRVVLPVSAAPSSKRVPQSDASRRGSRLALAKRTRVHHPVRYHVSPILNHVFSPHQGDGALLIHRGLRSSYYHRAKGRNNEMENPRAMVVLDAIGAEPLQGAIGTGPFKPTLALCQAGEAMRTVLLRLRCSQKSHLDPPRRTT